MIPNHYFCCCLATSIDLQMLKNEKTLATSCVDPSLHTIFGPSFLSFTPFQWHASSAHLSWSWDRRNGPSAQDWSCDTSGGDNTHRRCPVTFVAALCCAASLRFPDLRWGPVKVGCIKGRAVTKGQSPKAVLLLSPTYINRVKFDWISRFFPPFCFSWITMRMYSRSGATMISLDSEGCNDKTCGLKDLEGRISIQYSKYQLVF